MINHVMIYACTEPSIYVFVVFSSVLPLKSVFLSYGSQNTTHQTDGDAEHHRKTIIVLNTSAESHILNNNNTVFIFYGDFKVARLRCPPPKKQRVSDSKQKQNTQNT